MTSLERLADKPRKKLTILGATGSIGGTVTDQSGNPLAGVEIKAESDVLMGAGKVTHSNEEGSFNIKGLPPGIYKVTASQEGMNPAIQESVNVGITSTTEVDIIMEVKAAEGETITIIEAPPMISTSKPAIQTNIQLKTVQATPEQAPAAASAVPPLAPPCSCKTASRSKSSFPPRVLRRHTNFRPRATAPTAPPPRVVS